MNRRQKDEQKRAEYRDTFDAFFGPATPRQRIFGRIFGWVIGIPVGVGGYWFFRWLWGFLSELGR
jgi:hypothetical protein